MLRGLECYRGSYATLATHYRLNGVFTYVGKALEVPFLYTFVGSSLFHL